MRRALLRSWPALTRYYGLRPWDVDLLTIDELNEYLSDWEEHQRTVARELSRRRR